MNRFESMSISEEETAESILEETKDSPSNCMPDEGCGSSECCEDILQEELPPEDHHQKESKQKQLYDSFLAEIEGLQDYDAKLEKALAFMESSLSSSGSPYFKSFWDARNLCLELFKHNLVPSVRAHFWTKYTELSKEARRLKEMLEEQSAFATEQIEIAIQALEKEIENNGSLAQDHSSLEDFSCRSLEKSLSFYLNVQGELNLLNAQAARINALRKELIRTEMRIRIKNKFFQRLSGAGDRVFPRRKELIKDLSHNFMDDVDAFIQQNFSDENLHEPLFFLREEIKSLQAVAKLLTLNTHSFTQTRLHLSKCWDRIKEVEKERKKVKAQKKASFKQNQELVQQKIKALVTSLESTPHSKDEAFKKIDEIFQFMRQVELGREEINVLRDELNALRQPILDRRHAEEQKRIHHEREKERQRKELWHDLHSKCKALADHADSYEVDQLIAEKEALSEKIALGNISKIEKQELERLLKPLRDIIIDKKEQALMDLSDDDRQKLDLMRTRLNVKKKRRQEAQEQLRQFRKAKSGSGLNIAQALEFNSQIDEEQERLEKMNEDIQDIEETIKKLENQN